MSSVKYSNFPQGVSELMSIYVLCLRDLFLLPDNPFFIFKMIYLLCILVGFHVTSKSVVLLLVGSR